MPDKTPDKPLWYVRSKTGSLGPYTTHQIREFAANGKLPRTAHLSKSKDGPWTVAENAKGLFEDADEMTIGDFVPEVVKNSASALTSAISGLSKSMISHAKKTETKLASHDNPEPSKEPVNPPSPIVPAIVEPVIVTQVSRKPCPFCGESIALVAIKCKHCGEFLDESKRPAAINVIQHHAPQPIQTIVHMAPPQPRWSPGTAAVLSFLWPGLGQMYKGQVFNGLLWMVMTIGGYLFFIIPGLLLHLCCIVGAASGNPNK